MKGVTAPPDQDDVILWPCGEWCYRYELEEFNHKSDDYEVIAFGSQRWFLESA
jgi:hypothetical protein